jgi:hypothetical protein
VTGCYLDCFDYPGCPCGRADYSSGATGPLAGTGAGRTARKADTGAGFHPATRPITWLGDLLCRLGWHSVGFHYEDGYGSHGDDCARCGLGPLR